MADNVAITAGSGTSIATDDVSGVHFQRMKLVNGTLDATDAIGGDATNGLDVDVTRLIPGTTASALGKAEDAAHTDGDTGVLLLGVRNYAGAGTDADYSALSVTSDGLLKVRNHPNISRISVTSAGLTTATTAYSAGDQVGTEFAFANAVRASGGYGFITKLQLISKADIIGAYNVALFRASGTPAADNAAFSVSTTDVLNLVTVIPTSVTWDLGATRVAIADNVRIPFNCSATTLYAWLYTQSAHTFFAAVGDLILELDIEQA